MMCPIRYVNRFDIDWDFFFIHMQHTFELVQLGVYQIRSYLVLVNMILVRLHRAVMRRCDVIWNTSIKGINS